MRPSPARAQLPDPAAKRAELRRAYAEVIARGEFDDASHLSLARAVGATPAMLKYYFGSKGEMLWSIISCHIETILVRLEQDAPETLAPRDRVFALALAYAATIEAHEAEHAVTLCYKRHLTIQRCRDARHMQRWVLHVFDTAMQAVLPPDRRDQVMPLALSLVAMLNGGVTWFRHGRSLSRDAYADMAARMVLSETPPIKRSRRKAA